MVVRIHLYTCIYVGGAHIYDYTQYSISNIIMKLDNIHVCIIIVYVYTCTYSKPLSHHWYRAEAPPHFLRLNIL